MEARSGGAALDPADLAADDGLAVLPAVLIADTGRDALPDDGRDLGDWLRTPLSDRQLAKPTDMLPVGRSARRRSHIEKGPA